ncbi:hypothetical protein [Aquabacterium sp.]
MSKTIFVVDDPLSIRTLARMVIKPFPPSSLVDAVARLGSLKS